MNPEPNQNYNLDIDELDSETKPIPTWIKVGGGILILAIILIWSLLSGDSGNDNKTKDALSTLEQSKPETETKNKGKAILIKPGQKPNTLTLKPIVPEPLKKIEKPVWVLSEENQKRIEKLENQLAQSQAKAVTILQQLGATKATVARFNTQVFELKKSLAQHQALAQKKKTVTRKIRRRPARLNTPFTLVSIDVWGEKQEAVLRYSGQIFTLRPGALFMGWGIDGFDSSNEAVTFRNNRGRLVTLNAKG